MSEIHAASEALLAARGIAASRARGIGVAVQAPVTIGRGEPVDARADARLGRLLDPALVRARTTTRRCWSTARSTLMALGEHWTHWRDVDHLLFVDVGATIELRDRVRRAGPPRRARARRATSGTSGSPATTTCVCRCGNTGCLEAVAGGDALAARPARPAWRRRARPRRRRARARGRAARAAGRPRRGPRPSARCWRECINFFNPGAIVVGGDVAEAHQQLLAGVREAAIGRSLPMATRDLRMGRSRLGDRAGVIGAAVMVIEHVLAPENVDRAGSMPRSSAAGSPLACEAFGLRMPDFDPVAEARRNWTPTGATSRCRR